MMEVSSMTRKQTKVTAAITMNNLKPATYSFSPSFAGSVFVSEFVGSNAGVDADNVEDKSSFVGFGATEAYCSSELEGSAPFGGFSSILGRL